jgi:hypothetical protein
MCPLCSCFGCCTSKCKVISCTDGKTSGFLILVQKTWNKFVLFHVVQDSEVHLFLLFMKKNIIPEVLKCCSWALVFIIWMSIKMLGWYMLCVKSHGMVYWEWSFGCAVLYTVVNIGLHCLVYSTWCTAFCVRCVFVMVWWCLPSQWQFAYGMAYCLWYSALNQSW